MTFRRVMVVEARLGDHGDIGRAYNADRLAADLGPRSAFRFEGESWIVTGKASKGGRELMAEAYRLRDPDFVPPPAAGDLGPYHGRTVLYRGARAVLVGPPVQFIPGAVAPMQKDLFL